MPLLELRNGLSSYPIVDYLFLIEFTMNLNLFFKSQALFFF